MSFSLVYMKKKKICKFVCWAKLSLNLESTYLSSNLIGWRDNLQEYRNKGFLISPPGNKSC